TVEVNTVVAMLDGGDGAGAQAPGAEASAPASQAAVSPEPPPPPPVPAAPQARSQAQAAPPPAPPPAAPAAPAPAARAESAAPRPAAQAPSAAPPQGGNGRTQTVEDLRRTKSSPLVRNIAKEHGIDISQLEGTGMSGRVTKNDILSYIESGATSPAQAPAAPAPAIQAPPTVQPAAEDRVEQMSVMRKRIAEHMVLSRRTSAHVTTVYEIDMTRIAKLREQHKASFQERTGTKLTYMPFIFQAVTSAIRKFPIFNAQVSGDQIIYKRDINLGMAVALDWGLIVPVIKRADDLSISGLARAANDLAERARTKQLKPDEVAGGTFTITNPGVFGGLFGTPIINQPQLAILGVGAIEKRPKVLTTPEGDDYIAIRSMAYFALSFDHRVIDGADAEKFLAYIKEILEAGQFTL
ncbi:MAG TPA: dihydrolipoamide acetyltransferase family protein, partial [Pyrinomonadaceae bacterium]|nr:dihydrolipoamide acetyltransferase family protein [Pyrinomonadaceae bacterium]